MIYRYLPLLAFFLAFGSPAHALEVVWVDGLENNTPIRPKSILSFFSNGERVINGALKYSVKSECHPQNLETLSKASGLKDFNQKAEAYFNKCKKQLKRNGRSGLFALGDIEKLRYNLNENPNITSHRFYYDNGESTEGLLALKETSTPRPLVIIKCGLFCTGVDGPTVKEMMIHFADQSPFHVLYLGNHSGINNVKDNKRLTFGGYYEAHEVLAIAKWFNEHSPVRHKINKLHMLGISLGGSSAFFTSLYNDLSADQTGKRYISSVLAFCPVVDLKPSITKVYRGVVGIGTAGRTWKSLKQVYNIVPDIQDLINPNSKKPGKKHFPKIMGTAAFRHISRIPQSDLIPKFPERGINELEDFWTANKFSDHYQKVKTPVLVWASKDDPVVKYSLNSGNLKNKLMTDIPNENIQVLALDRGSHCAFSSSYGWPTTTHLLSSYFKMMSPELQQQEVELDYTYSRPRVAIRSKHIDQIWKVRPNKKYVRLTFRAYTTRYHGCRERRMFRSKRSEFCFEETTAKIPFSHLAETLNLKMPKNHTDAQRMTRWLNHTSTVVDSENKPLRESRERPYKIKFKLYN